MKTCPSRLGPRHGKQLTLALREPTTTVLVSSTVKDALDAAAAGLPQCALFDGTWIAILPLKEWKRLAASLSEDVQQ